MITCTNKDEYMKGIRQLAELLAPGKRVTDIKLHLPVVNGTPKATIEVLMDEADVAMAVWIVEACK